MTVDHLIRYVSVKYTCCVHGNITSTLLEVSRCSHLSRRKQMSFAEIRELLGLEVVWASRKVDYAGLDMVRVLVLEG